MPIQYNEFYNEKTGLTVGVQKLLFSRQSDYQLVEVYETDTWGNLMTIDGMVMLSEKDEFVYHEMIAHVALFTHPNPKRVLIIGGGDGGTAREALKHESVEQVDLVEIDKTVVEASRLHFPDVGDFNNPRLNVIHDDGIAFVKNIDNPYDIVIIDGSDPVGPAEGLFNKSFYQNCFNHALAGNGVLTTQTESPWVQSYHSSIKSVYDIIDSTFGNCHMYLCSIPLYPSGLWSMMCGTKGGSPESEATLARIESGVSRIEDLRYYNKKVHQAAFALPGFVEDIIS